MKINFESDFDFIITGMFGNLDCDWKLQIYAKNKSYRKFNVAHLNGEFHNCFVDEGKIHVVCNNHGLPTGELYGNFYADLPNSIYPDGKKLTSVPIPLGITLVSGAGDDISEVDVQVVLPFVYVSAYQMAVAQGYQGTEKDYIAALNQLPELNSDINQLSDDMAFAQDEIVSIKDSQRQLRGIESSLNEYKSQQEQEIESIWEAIGIAEDSIVGLSEQKRYLTGLINPKVEICHFIIYDSSSSIVANSNELELSEIENVYYIPSEGVFLAKKKGSALYYKKWIGNEKYGIVAENGVKPKENILYITKKEQFYHIWIVDSNGEFIDMFEFYEYYAQRILENSHNITMLGNSIINVQEELGTGMNEILYGSELNFLDGYDNIVTNGIIPCIYSLNNEIESLKSRIAAFENDSSS